MKQKIDMILGRQITAATALMTLAVMARLATPALAELHTWSINEIFSNGDGSVQFIEMREAFGLNYENRLAGAINYGHTFETNANVFTYTTNLPSIVTANKFFLMATPGFDLLSGGVTPDYTIPTQFFSLSGDTLRFSPSPPGPFITVDTFTFGLGNLPTNGNDSLNRDLSTGTNSPTNFAGLSGLLELLGDVDLDGGVGVADIDTLYAEVPSSVPPSASRFDLNFDNNVDQADVDELVLNILGSRFGDFNLDLTVSFADFGILQTAFGGPGGWAQGDANGTGDTTFADFGILQANFGSTGTGAPAAVPEPATLTLLALGGLMLARRRRGGES